MADAPTDAELIEAYDATYNRMRTFDRHVHALRAVVEKFTPSPPVAAPPATPLAPVAWGAFYFGGKHDGKLYSHCPTEPQIMEYIATVHQSNDSITLRHGPLYAAAQPQPQPAQPLTGASDPLQPEVNWHKQAWAGFNVRDIQDMFMVGPERAQRLFDAAITAPSTPTPPEVAP